jgi:hypothetical protein
MFSADIILLRAVRIPKRKAENDKQTGLLSEKLSADFQRMKHQILSVKVLRRN